MSDPFVGEIRLFAGNFPPQGWAFCDGELLAISQNETLFSLIGTTYGGDGEQTFALPDLRGRVPVGVGQGPGLSARTLGEAGGEEAVALTKAQMPAHTHHVRANAAPGTTGNLNGSVPAKGGAYAASYDSTLMDAYTVGNAGAGHAHSNVGPTLAVSFIIALTGIYPSPP